MAETINSNVAADSKLKPKKINKSKVSPTKLREYFEEYLTDCNIRLRFVNIAGFCVFAGISRQTYYTYKNDERYSSLISYFEDVMEDEALNYRNDKISTLYLKNKFGYADKVESRNMNTTSVEAFINSIDDDGLDL
jgi:hypothetical protein